MFCYACNLLPNIAIWTLVHFYWLKSWNIEIIMADITLYDCMLKYLKYNVSSFRECCAWTFWFQRALKPMRMNSLNAYFKMFKNWNNLKTILIVIVEAQQIQDRILSYFQKHNFNLKILIPKFWIILINSLHAGLKFKQTVFWNIFSCFSQERGLGNSCRRQNTWNAKVYLYGKIRKILSICHLLNETKQGKGSRKWNTVLECKNKVI